MTVTDLHRMEAELVAGLLLHPEAIPHAMKLVRPGDLEHAERREVLRDIFDAYVLGYFKDRGGIDRGYRSVGAYMADRGTWTGRLFRLGDADTRDPIGAAQVIAERQRRRHLVAELVSAAEAVANGSDPDVVLRRLEVVA